MSHHPDLQVHRLPRELRRELLDRVAAVVSQRHEILFCYAHGSFARGDPFRDLDLTIFLDGDLPASRFAYEDELNVEIQRTLHVDFPVDVRILNGAPFPFQHHGCRGQLLLDRDPDRRAAIMAHIASRYLDLKPILEHHAREAFGHAPGS